MAFTKVVGAGIHTLSNITSHNINSSGIITATKFVGPIEGDITAVDATFTGNVSIAKTLTYEDVKNVDSVGIVTARQGIHIDDSIVHIGDTDTKIRFPEANKISFETAGTERFKIIGAPTNVSNHIAIGSSSSSNSGNYYLAIKGYERSSEGASGDTVNIGIINQSRDPAATANIDFRLGQASISNTAAVRLLAGKGGNWTNTASTRDGYFAISIANNAQVEEKLRITNSGRVGIGTDSPTFELDLRTTGQADLLIGSYNAGGARLMLDGDSNGDGSGGDFCEIMADTGGDLTINARNPASDAEMIFKTGGGTEQLRIESGGGLKFTGQGTSIPIGGILHHTNNNLYVRGGTNGLILSNDNNYTTVQIYDSYIKFETNDGTEKVRIGSNGSVGIGTDYLSSNNSVYHKLMVEGDTTSSIAVAKILRRNSSASNSTYTFEVDSSVHTSNMVSGGAMAVDVYGGRAFTIDGNGKVGINTTLPTKKLHINTTGTSSEGILLKATDSTYPSFIGDANRGGTDLFLVALQGYWNGNRVGEVTVESGSDITNKDEGMVKIRTRNAGDSSPQDRLTVYHTGQTQVHSTTDSSSTTTGSLVVSGGIGVAKNIICGGKIGLNSNTPLYPLHLSNAMGSSPSFIHMEVTGSNTVGGGGGIAFDTSASNNASSNTLYLATIAGIRNSDNDGSNDLVFSTSKNGVNSNLPSEKLRIDSSGRLIVGGGTHAGGSALVVKGGNQNTYSTIGMFSNHTNPSDDTLLSQIRFGSNTSAVGADIRIYADDDWGNNDYPSRMEFYTTANNSNDRKKRLAINSTGNIGINCGKTTLEGGVDIGTSELTANSNTPLIIGTEGGQNRFLKVNFFNNQQNFHSLTLRCNDNGIMNQLDISNPFGGAGYGSGIRFTGYGNDIGGKIEMINHTTDNAAKMYMRFKAGGDNERMRIDQNGKVIVASGTLHSTRVLARFGIDCHGMNIFDGVGTVANYGMAFYNDPNTNYANGIGFFNDDGQTCGGYIVHQDKGGSNVGDIIMATAATANAPVERLTISSLGNIKQNLSSPSGTSPFQNTHWYDRDGGNYTLTAIDDNYLSATKNDSSNGYNDLIYKRVRMSKNCDIEFELSGNSPAGTYRHVGFVINGDGTATHDNWDRLVFRSRPGNTANNQIRIDKGGGGYGFNEQSSSIPTFFDGTERHILIQLRDRLVNVIVDGEVIISQKTNADFNRSQGWFGFGIYEGGESANIVIRNLTIKNKFIQPHWLVRATGVNIDVNSGNPLPFNQVIKASSDMNNTSHYNNSSYRFTAPISGMYYCFVRAYRNSSNGSEVAFYVNGSVRNRFKPVPNGGDYIFAGSCLIQLMKGNYIDVRAHSANFGNFYGNSNQSFSSWGGHLID